MRHGDGEDVQAVVEIVSAITARSTLDDRHSHCGQFAVGSATIYSFPLRIATPSKGLLMESESAMP